MRSAWSILAVGLLVAMPVVPAFAANEPPVDAPIISCGNGIPGGVYCAPSKKDLKQARTAYERGLKLQDHQQMEEAFAQFDQALRLVPEDARFLSAREMTKSQLVFQHTERGDSLLAQAQPATAAAEFHAALKLDPDNAYVEERLTEALRDPGASRLDGVSSTLTDAGEIDLQPKAERATFHYRGDVRGLFSELGSAYGISTEFDDSVQAKRQKRCAFTWTMLISSPPSAWHVESARRCGHRSTCARCSSRRIPRRITNSMIACRSPLFGARGKHAAGDHRTSHFSAKRFATFRR